MDISLYKNSIDKITKKFQEIKNKTKKALIVFSIILLILFAFAVLFLKMILGLAFYCLSFAFAFLGYSLIFIISYIRRLKFVFSDFSNLVFDIIENESPIDSLERKIIEEYILTVKEARFSLLSDSVNIYSAVTIYKDDLKFDLISCNVVRNAGKSSTQILNGLIVNLNTKTSLDLLIRTNKMQFKSSYISKVNNSDSYKVIYPKGKNDEKIPKFVIEEYEELKRLFNVSKCGINYDGNIILYLETKNIFKSIKDVNKEIVKDYCEMYNEYIEKIIDFSKKIEKENIE